MTSSFIQTSDQQPFNTALNGNMDRTVLGMDVEKFWLNHPSLTHLDLLSPKGSPQLPEMLLSPTFQSSEPKAFLLSSPEPLLTLLSINQNSQDSPAGVPQTCFMDNGGQDVAKHDRNPSPLWHDYYSTRDCQGGAQNCNRESDVHAMTTSQEPDHPGALNKACDGSSQMQTNGTLEEGLRIHSLWNISQNAALVDQASRLQKRLLAMLGEHASRHYSHQREGLRRKLLNVSYCPKSPMASGGLFTHTRNEMFIDEEMQEDEVLRQIHQTREQSLKSRDLENLAQCGCAVLHGMLDALDSDATLSSSSDEDAEGSSAASRCHGCEWKWLKERAELCSRWTWLQMRLSELDSQIQQLGELHKQILANRGHVVLAETQPLTDRQIQHTLWTETMDLSFTAGNMQDLSSDVDMEPSSPTRLLRNIERQSAQLTQIVNSLMPPFCASPSSSPVTKRPCSHWRDHQKIAFGSQVQADTAEPVSLPNGPQCLRKTGQKRKRVCHRRKCPLLMDITSVSARTRPLLTYHKPCLFIMDPSSYREQALDSFRSLRHTCDPATVCTDPTCPHRKEKTASKVHPVLSLSSDTLSSLHLQNALKSDLLRSQNCLGSRCRASRSLFYCNHQPKNSRHLKNHRRESTLMRWACTRVHPRKAHREDKRKRRCSEWLTDVAHWSDVSSLSDENLLEECSEDAADCTPTQQRNSQIRLRSRSSESIFSIDDIVIPVSLVSSLKVERHQYKDILTPSWRKVDIFPLLNKEEDEQNELEPITDEDFRQRHQSYEHKESSWNLSRRHRLSRRRCSAVSVRIHPAHCHPTVDSSVSSTQTSSPPEGQTEACVDDREPVPPWKRRVFEDDEALRSDEDF